MTDERPYGRHFAPRNEDDCIEDPHSPEAASVPVEPDEQVQETDQPDCESSCVSSEYAESSEDVVCHAEAAEMASEDLEQKDWLPGEVQVDFGEASFRVRSVVTGGQVPDGHLPALQRRAHPGLLGRDGRVRLPGAPQRLRVCRRRSQEGGLRQRHRGR